MLCVACSTCCLSNTSTLVGCLLDCCRIDKLALTLCTSSSHTPLPPLPHVGHVMPLANAVRRHSRAEQSTAVHSSCLVVNRVTNKLTPTTRTVSLCLFLSPSLSHTSCTHPAPPPSTPPLHFRSCARPMPCPSTGPSNRLSIHSMTTQKLCASSKLMCMSLCVCVCVLM